MTIKSNYFDGISYTASDAVAPFKNLLSNGVFNLYGNDFIVTAHSPNNLSVNVAAGQAIINGYYVNNDSDTTVTITSNTSGYNRIDLIVANVDVNNKTTTITAVQGVANSNPICPTPTVDQLPLAQVYVGNNVSVISSNNITDMRVSVDTQTLQTNSKFRQAIINGNFDVWQRKTSFSNPNGYTVDRWVITSDGTGQTSIANRQTFTTGSSEILPLPHYFLRYQVSVAATAQTYNRIIQRIEDVRVFAGQWVTLSFFVRADTTRNISVSFTQNFGSGGSPSASISGIGSKSFSAGTGWYNVVMPVFIPNILGKTIGTNDDTYLALVIDLPVNTAMYFDLAQVQLNVGVTPLPYNPKTFLDELHECMRYYEKSYDYAVNPGTIDDNGQVIWNLGVNSGIRRYTVPYKVRKRVNPVVTVYDGNGTSGQITLLDSADAVSNDSTGFAIQYQGQNSFCISSSTANKSGLIFHWTADAEI